MAGMTAIAASPTHNIATMRRPSTTGHTVRRLATGLMNATKRMSDAIATGATIIAIARTATTAIGIAANGVIYKAKRPLCTRSNTLVSNALSF